MPRALMLAFAEPQDPSQDEDFNTWYDNKHIPDVLRLPGAVAATRYRLPKGIDLLPDGPDFIPQRYLAIYEIKGETDAEMAAFADEIKSALADGRANMHSTMKLATLGATFAVPITDTVQSPHR